MKNAMFATKMLDKIHTTGLHLKQHWNAGAIITTRTRMGYWCGIKFWVNEGDISNLLSVPDREKDDHKLESNTMKWVACSHTSRKQYHCKLQDG